ncbi:hypothetical protein VTK26DRAFT_8041 [Humicola hyalothermophila]
MPLDLQQTRVQNLNRSLIDDSSETESGWPRPWCPTTSYPLTRRRLVHIYISLPSTGVVFLIDQFITTRNIVINQALRSTYHRSRPAQPNSAPLKTR